MATRNFATNRDKNSGAEFYTYRYRTYPSSRQEEYFSRCFGCCRFLWNHLVADEKEFYDIMGTSLGNTPADYKDDYPS